MDSGLSNNPIPRFYLLFSKECAYNTLVLRQLNILPSELIHLIALLYIKSYQFDNMKLDYNDDTHTLLFRDNIYLWNDDSRSSPKPGRFDIINVKQISNADTMLILTDELLGCKNNSNKQINNSKTDWFDSPQKIILPEINIKDIIHIESGSDISIVINKTCIWTWGCDTHTYGNSRGLLGRGDLKSKGIVPIINSNEYYPIGKIDIGGGIKAKCKFNHTILLTNCGLYSWGSNTTGQLGLGDELNRDTPHKINLSSIVDIESGTYHNMAIVYDPSFKKYCLYGWGSNIRGELGLGNYERHYSPQKIDVLGSVISISCAHSNTLCLTTNGLYVWGDGISIPKKINIPDVIIICAGYFNHTIITKNHKIITWPVSFGDEHSFFTKYKNNSWNIYDGYEFTVCWLDISDIIQSDPITHIKYTY